MKSNNTNRFLFMLVLVMGIIMGGDRPVFSQASDLPTTDLLSPKLKGDLGRYFCADLEVTEIYADVINYRNEALLAKNIEVVITNVGTMDYRIDRRNYYPKTVSLIFMDGRGRGPAARGLPYVAKIGSIPAGYSTTMHIPDHTIGFADYARLFDNGEVTLYAEVDVGDVIPECDEDNNTLEQGFETP